MWPRGAGVIEVNMIYAIGDIHGQLDMLETALSRIEQDGGADAHVVFLGDYVDRGPDSRGVVQALIDGLAAGRNWTVLRGNHDRMFCRFVTDGIEHDNRISSGKGWLHPALGGRETLMSYGVDPDAPDASIKARAAVPAEHLAFLASRDLWFETEALLFVHAGILPGVAMEDQTEDDLIWIRPGFLDHPGPFHEKLVVHGHTALDRPERYAHRIDLDGGAGYGRPLIPAVFDQTGVYLLTKAGREPMDILAMPSWPN